MKHSLKHTLKYRFFNFARFKALIRNAHWQTIIPIYLTNAFIKVNYQRQRIYTPDNDFLDLDWVNPGIYDQPTLILFHGMEGNSESHYAKRIMYHIQSIGWRGVVAHARGCSGELNHTLNSYHGGYTNDIEFIIRTIKKITPNALFVSGVSLGANALLKLLGTNLELASQINAAFAISTPFDLQKTALELDRGINKRLYTPYFLRSLLPKMQMYADRFPKLTLSDQIDSLDKFNQHYITQMYQFKTALDYYQEASCINYLNQITTPTLILQAANDPMIKPDTWPQRQQLSNSIRFIGLNGGGHGGFVGNDQNYLSALLRLPQLMVKYFNNHK